MNAVRAIYRYWTAAVFVAVVAQIAAAGYGAFHAAEKVDEGTIDDDTFTAGFDFHSGFGYIIFLATIVLFLLALAVRRERRWLLWNGLAPVLLVVQILLAGGGEDVPFIGALHAANALLIFLVVGALAHRAWRTRMAPEPVAARAPDGP